MSNGMDYQNQPQQDYREPSPQYTQPGQQYPQYQQPAPQPPPQAYNPAKEDVKSILRIAGIIAIIFGVLLIIWGAISILGIMALDAMYQQDYGVSIGAMAYVLASLPLIFGIFDFIIYSQTKQISHMVDMGMYPQAKSKTLIWTILGFLLGGIIIGIVMLVAYLKFDNLMRPPAPPGYAPQYSYPQYQQPPQPAQSPPPQPYPQNPPQPNQPYPPEQGNQQ